MRRRDRWIARFVTLLELVGLTALTLGIGYWSGDLRGFPKGYDALGHLSKVKLILEAWPHINWNDAWQAGLPNFTGSYPPGYHLLVAAVTRIDGTSVPTAMLVVTGLSLVLLTLGCYGFVRLASRSRVIAWLAVLAILAEPTLWEQSLQSGLYPRLLSLGVGAAALPAAVLYGRRPSRLRGASLVLLLAGSLSAHPFVGVVMSLFAAGVVVIMGEDPSLQARAKRLVAPAGILFLLVAYFYVPLVLLPRSQSAFTNTEVPLPWAGLVFPGAGRPTFFLGAWSPITLPLIAAGLLAALLYPLLGPSAKVDPWNLQPTPNPSQRLDPFLAELADANERRRRYRPLLALTIWAWLFGAAFLVYCLLGHFQSTFPYYVNGLQPGDIIVYAALFAVLGSAFALTPAARRGAVPLLLVGALGTGLLGVYLPGQALNYNDTGRQMMEGMVTAHVPSQHIYRIAAGDQSTAEWLSGWTQTPETAGYQAQGDLHPSWQVWLDEAILGTGQTSADRKFLFDWYAVKWILVHNQAPYKHEPAYYQLVERGATVYGTPTTLWAVRKPTPMFTASGTRPLLFIGDDPHYNLLLRSLAAANINSSELIPVEGGDSLAGYSLDDLRSYREVVLWGSPVGPHGAKLLDEYVQGGGRVFVDEGEAKPLFPAGAEPVGPFAVKTIRRTWNWADVQPASLPQALLHKLPPPNYAGSNVWQATYPKQLPSNAVVLARSHGRVELAAVHEGKGVLVWSGINLPYLASSTHSPTAARLLVDLATGTTTPKVVALGSSARRLNPEHWEFTVPAGTKGVLLRQYTSADWHASNAATGAALPIRSAGPGMTYVSLPPGRTSTTIELRYELSAPEEAGFWLSGLGVIVLLLYAGGFVWPRRLR